MKKALQPESEFKLTEIRDFPWSETFFAAFKKNPKETSLELIHLGLGLDGRQGSMDGTEDAGTAITTIQDQRSVVNATSVQPRSMAKASAGASLAAFAGLMPAAASWLTSLDLR